MVEDCCGLRRGPIIRRQWTFTCDDGGDFAEEMLGKVNVNPGQENPFPEDLQNGSMDPSGEVVRIPENDSVVE